MDAAASVLATSPTPALVVLSGLPGVGKTTIARALAARLACAYVRIDSIEQALKTLNAKEDVGPAGYVVAYELARSNLALGMTVVADCVNPLAVTREAWQDVAASAASALLEVEVICSDMAEHRRRVESRRADIRGQVLPTWEMVRGVVYAPWTSSRLVIDSAEVAASDAADLIWRAMRARGAST